MTRCKQYILLLISILTLPLYAKDFVDMSTTTANSIHDFLTDLESNPSLIISPENVCKRAQKKKWTFIVYLAADNDLKSFAARNIKQMATVGSNKNINIVVQLDIKASGKKTTRRYYVEQNKLSYVNAEDPNSQRMDSGDPRSLISCCQWAIHDYPAEQYALILWNHGTGIIDPATGRIINPSELFTFNPVINKLELDRSIGFLDFVTAVDDFQRGVCWDDSTGNYLSNQKLDLALNTICNQLLGGQKLDIIGFDACLMSMLEVSNIMKKYAKIMVGSQEVELGTGWPYDEILAPFASAAIDPVAFAKHIVAAYNQAYAKITNDFTQSAIDLSRIETLEQKISLIGALLQECLKNQQENSVRITIKTNRNKFMCTHFDEPSYIDLHHFLLNLKASIKNFKINGEYGETLKNQLSQETNNALNLIKSAVIASATGNNLRLAQGISIYFPEQRLHPSYRKTYFAERNAWFPFLLEYFQTV